MNWRDVWKHQLRWARTIRVCQPLPYFFSILSNATFWPLLWLIAEFLATTVQASSPGSSSAGFTIMISFRFGVIAALGCVLIRIWMACDLQRRLTGFANVNYFWLVPVKDLLQAAIWLGAFMGSTVEWRGRRMKLRQDGTLVEER